ncbi:MAG: hypothetical protein IIW23_03835 [Clostridia bacterium]|nr:hypothetical protein [Clostridia bacterium]
MKNAVISHTGAPKEGELDIINSMTRRPFTAEELYVFSVTLCDNDIDRDFERFTLNALNSLAQMYVGKTGIFDHSMKGKDQVARIFSCRVESKPGVFTKDGLPYSCLTARAYMPRTAKNEELIVDIDAGINKEVSVGCSMESATCSVCGIDRRIGCSHKNGRHYKKDGVKVLCHTVLDNPKDAFEWSFVAVPAQPKAGVTKAFCPKGEVSSKTDVATLLAKKLGIDSVEPDALDGFVSRIKSLANKGENYLEELKKRALGEISSLCGNDSARIMKESLERMNADELENFCKSVHAHSLAANLPKPQTASATPIAKNGENNFNFIV